MGKEENYGIAGRLRPPPIISYEEIILATFRGNYFVKKAKVSWPIFRCA